MLIGLCLIVGTCGGGILYSKKRTTGRFDLAMFVKWLGSWQIGMDVMVLFKDIIKHKLRMCSIC